MKAYAIFDGGGIKTAALAGCLAAAQDQGIRFVGYGGTSAGSIIALFGSVGYSGEELGRRLIETDLNSFLDDHGSELRALQQLLGNLKNGKVRWRYLGLDRLLTFARLKGLFGRLNKSLGLYSGDNLTAFVLGMIRERQPGLAQHSDITFSDLAECGCPPLKLVASDITKRRPVTFSQQDTDYGDSVITAVRASASYPFLFAPVEARESRLVDGGVCSNLPSFLFRREYEQTRLPTFAFDLIPAANTEVARPGLFGYARDMLQTALQATDQLVLSMHDAVIHIPIEVPREIDTLDFHVSADQRQALYNAGYAATACFLSKFQPLQLLKAADHELRKELMAVYGDPDAYAAVLSALSRDVEEISEAKDVNAYIMLPTGRGSHMVVYAYGMDNGWSRQIELPEDAGWSGRAWNSGRPVLADLDNVRDDLGRWGLKPEHLADLGADRKSLICFPIFSTPDGGGAGPGGTSPVGILTVDSSTPIADTGWVKGGAVDSGIVQYMQVWACVAGRLMP